MTHASIVIPTFNKLELLVRCVTSIRAHTGEPHEIVVVDNGSTDDTVNWCRMQGDINLLALPTNEGFPSACNRGLRLASGDTLVLLNNDTVVSPNWLGNLTRALYSSLDVGIVGPLANTASGTQQTPQAYGNLAEFAGFAQAFNAPDPVKWRHTLRLVGLCMAFRRDMYDRIGELDERFSPGHYEDDDYCYRARLAGFRLLICGDTLLHHEGSASFGENPQEQALLVVRNYRLFMDKWHVDPRGFI